MESLHRSEDRASLDVNDLLSNGFWKTSRAQKASGRSSYSHNLAPSTPTNNTSHDESRRPSKSPRRPPRQGPPAPSVEDESVSLAREHGGSKNLTSHEPPYRGEIDQQPILLESEASTSDVDTPREFEIQNDNCERRFVIIPQPDKKSATKERTNTGRDAREKPHAPEQDAGKRPAGRGLSPPPPLSRRRSRQDLPSLRTKANAEMPPYRRSTSAYSYTPKGNDSARTNLTPSADTLLSPETATTGKTPSKSYFEMAAQSLPKKYSAPSPANSRPGTPVEEKRRSTGPLPNSRPGTPTSDNKRGGSLDAYGLPRKDLNEKLTRPQQLAEDNGIRRSAQYLSAEPDHYLSSDDDLTDSVSHHHRRRSHSRHRVLENLHTDESRERHHHHHHNHHRTPSGREPLLTAKISPNQPPPADKINGHRKDGYSSGREGRRPVSRSGSPMSDYSDPSKSSKSLNPADISRPARSHSRRRSPANVPDARTSSATLPMPASTRMEFPGEGPRSPAIPRCDTDPITRSASARPPETPKPAWPPAFHPSNSEPPPLDKPMGAYRRHSQDVEEGNIAPLPPCPRTLPTRGTKDWSTLPKAPSFNICPSCFNSSVARTEFRSSFVPAPPRSSHESVVCDFGSQPWYRIAWLLTRKEQLRDLRLLYSIADVTENSQPCLGRHQAVRRWHSVLDPESKVPIRDFDVCSSCVKCLEALLPCLRGIFVRTNNSDFGHPRQCDLRFDSKRFVHYFDALETMADEAMRYREPPDTRDFANLVKKFAKIPECPRDTECEKGQWFIIRELPEFTVCPECFEEAVLPHRRKGKAIPSMFNKTPHVANTSTSCQLYSPRMRAIFEKAVNANDYKLLAAKARDRKQTEDEMKADMAEQRRLSGGSKAAAIELARLQAEWRKWE